ncbi:MAG: SET domain-containing protein-lysine N-methyltransferase [Gammaproteobacteria bacterium]|nr:SET domain-containing protein-lysine N-methyltransferase [Gammaproteobacteria bacterium]
MKSALFIQPLSVKKSPIHGYGVFAEQDIAEGALIEECYLLLREKKDPAYQDYYFSAGEHHGLALGYGSLYNHADHPNADYDIDLNHNLLVIQANRFIAKGEEILIAYGEAWFSSRYKKAKLPLWYKYRKYKKTFKSLLRFVLITALLFFYIATLKTFFK